MGILKVNMIDTIELSRPESSNDGMDRSLLRVEKGERGDVVRNRSSPTRRAMTRFVARWPGVCLGAALCGGMVLGWWVKRR